MAKKWYAIRVQSEREEFAKQKIEEKLENSDCKDDFGRILIPVERVSEIKGGKKRVASRKIFAGYILVEVELNERTWFIINDVPGISGFVGPDRKNPTPLGEIEVQRILEDMELQKEKPKPKIEFDEGETVKVKEGPFESYDGVVDEIFPEKGILRINLSIFGRSTPVELEYWQVERV